VLTTRTSPPGASACAASLPDAAPCFWAHPVDRAEQPAVLDAGVMTRGDEISADLAGVLVELAELQLIVAAHAGIGGAAGGVLIDEVVDDAAKVFLEVADEERDAQFRRDGPGIGRVRDRAAPLVTDTERVLLGRLIIRGRAGRGQLIERLAWRSQAHEAADHVIPCAQEERRGDGRVNAAGHRDQNLWARVHGRS